MKISVQLYSLRDVGDFDAQLALARECGFDWVETVAMHGLPAREFADKVASHGLRVSSMHASLVQLESQPQVITEACHATGCPLVVMPFLPMGERPADAPAWQAMGQRLARLGDALRAEGPRLAYHNHDFEFLSYGGRPALDWLFDHSTPEQLGWEADLGWVCRAGADPWSWLERHGHRLAAVHAKDIAPARTAVDEDGWAALGQGVLPWSRLLPHLASRVDVLVFEHDMPRDARAILRSSRAFFAEHGLG
jgi:sugar phosphate isomerase/epimerase